MRVHVDIYIYIAKKSIYYIYVYIHSREERTPESRVRPSILSLACGLTILLRNTPESAHATHLEHTLETNRGAHSMPPPNPKPETFNFKPKPRNKPKR